MNTVYFIGMRPVFSYSVYSKRYNSTLYCTALVHSSVWNGKSRKIHIKHIIFCKAELMYKNFKTFSFHMELLHGMKQMKLQLKLTFSQTF